MRRLRPSSDPLHHLPEHGVVDAGEAQRRHEEPQTPPDSQHRAVEECNHVAVPFRRRKPETSPGDLSPT